MLALLKIKFASDTILQVKQIIPQFRPTVELQVDRATSCENPRFSTMQKRLKSANVQMNHRYLPYFHRNLAIMWHTVDAVATAMDASFNIITTEKFEKHQNLKPPNR